jgi:hypothetical protein
MLNMDILGKLDNMGELEFSCIALFVGEVSCFFSGGTNHVRRRIGNGSCGDG